MTTNISTVLQGLGADPYMDLSDLSVGALAQIDGILGANPRTATSAARQNVKKTMKTKQQPKNQPKMAQETRDLTGRTLFNSRLDFITDPEVREGLKSGKFSLTDFTLYAVKKADGNRIEMFQTADSAKDGVTNLTQSKLPTNAWFLAQEIVIQSGVNAAPTTDPEGKLVNFSTVAPSIATGNYSFGNGTTVFAADSGMDVFKHDGGNGILKGAFKLENPKMINPKMDLKFDIDTAGGHAANTYIRIAIRGSMIVKA